MSLFGKTCGDSAYLKDSASGFQVDAVITVEGIGLQVSPIVFQKRGWSVLDFVVGRIQGATASKMCSAG
jgi:hypothetical protein